MSGEREEGKEKVLHQVKGGSGALARDTKRKKETSSLKAKKARVQIQVPRGTSSTGTNNFNTEAMDVVFA